MTVYALETALHDLGVKKQARAEFAADPARFLSGYRLDQHEVDMVRNFDVLGLQKAGVSALLTLGFWMMNEPGRSRAQYLDRLNQRESVEKA